VARPSVQSARPSSKQYNMSDRPAFRGGVTETEPSPSEKSTQKFLGLPFAALLSICAASECWCHKHHNDDYNNCCKMHSECIRMHHVERENT